MWTNKRTDGVKHTADCKRVFGRYDLTCPRCRELAQGMPARKGWGDDKAAAAAQLSAAIKAHDFVNCTKCGVKGMCVCFDW